MAGRYGARLVLGVSGYDVAMEQERLDKVLGDRGRRVADQHRARRRRRRPARLAAGRHRRTRGADGAGLRVPQVAREYDHVRTDHAYGAMLALRHFVRSVTAGSGSTCRPPSRRTGCGRGSRRRPPRWRRPVPVAGGAARAGDDPTALAQLDAFLAECESFGSRAVLVHSDEHGARLVERAMERGLRVPEDLAVIAYNDVTAALAVVPLTAVCPPKLALGETACELLLRKIGAAPGARPPSTSACSRNSASAPPAAPSNQPSPAT